MLVCLESLQRLGANDLQTDSPAGFACPAALWPPSFLRLYWIVLEPVWSTHITKAFWALRKNNGVASHICKRLKCSWEELLHSLHGCTPVSSGHQETSESTSNCQSLFSCPIAPICLPRDGISLHTHICSHMQTLIHIQSCTPRSCPAQHV